MSIPANAQRTADAVIDVSVSQYTYPNDQTKPASKDAKVTVTLITETGEKGYEAKHVKRRRVPGRPPAADLEPSSRKLHAGG